jgi:phosphotransferase system enzyme I (PtsP)
MFPMIAEADEFRRARGMVEAEVDRLAAKGHPRPSSVKVGFMLETPSLVYASDRLYQEADFASVGGNDLLQFFFAADRENERVRQRYDMLNFSFLRMLRQIVERCERVGTPLSFCGEAAGRPLEALVLAAIGFRDLSMRPAAIGPVKRVLLAADLSAVRAELERIDQTGATSARAALKIWAKDRSLPA